MTLEDAIEAGRETLARFAKIEGTALVSVTVERDEANDGGWSITVTSRFTELEKDFRP
jgi:hypothetical protein